MLSPDGSCRAAVARLLAWLVAHGRPPCRPHTGPYCKARRRLPEPLLRRLARETGRRLHRGAPDGWLWQGRRVKVVDGTTLSMPDTPANQAAYPQSPSQQPGLGFPLARAVAVFSLACGAALDLALGRYQGKQAGENALPRGLDGALEEGDVVLADRYFGGYFDLALWQPARHRRRGPPAPAAAGGLPPRPAPGPGRPRRDWAKPQRPDWLDEAAYRRLPASLQVREVRVRVGQAGFRTGRAGRGHHAAGGAAP